jgi:glycine/D-amino acid oxidase-like deaminating enzyme
MIWIKASSTLPRIGAGRSGFQLNNNLSSFLRTMGKRIAVLSTGAIGSCVGADLTRAGHDVVLIDQWPAQVEAMKSFGLNITIQGVEAQIPVRALHLGEIDPYRDLFEIVFLTAKSYDTVWIVHFIKPHLKPDGVLVSIQNSLNDEWIAPIIWAASVCKLEKLWDIEWSPFLVCRQRISWIRLTRS